MIGIGGCVRECLGVVLGAEVRTRVRAAAIGRRVVRPAGLARHAPCACSARLRHGSATLPELSYHI